MTFTSRVFVVFFFVVYAAYLLLRGDHRRQNAVLLVASYVFYGWWDWRFLTLLAGTSFLDFWIGRAIERSPSPTQRKRYLTASIIANLAVLGFFKYFNFFADSAARLLHVFGMDAGSVALNVVLPVGISFYTFQSMSYTIDVYRGDVAAVRRFSDFALYVSFFPQLVAGPIERSSNLVPAVLSRRTITWDQVNAGIFLIAWGYLKKVVVADNLASIANTVFNNHAAYSGVDLFLGALAFSFQIYGDFSGYSDIARGLAKLMGFELMINFKLPYLARNPKDFWQRWHISLSTWLRDYLYIPLGGNRGGRPRMYRNLLLTMLLGGLWHGAAWNFVIWGLYHGLLLVAFHAIERVPVLAAALDSKLLRVPQVLLMFGLTVVGWIFFRAHSWEQIAYFFTRLGVGTSAETAGFAHQILFFAAPLMIVEVVQQRSRDLLVFLRLPTPARSLALSLIVLWMLVFGVREPMEFIYFQF